MNISEEQEQRRKAQREAQRVIEQIERIEAQMDKVSVLSAEWDELNEKRKLLTVKARQKENPVGLGKESLNLHYLVVQFMHTPAQRHLSTDIQFHLLFLWHKRVGVKGIDKKFERTCKQYCEHQ